MRKVFNVKGDYAIFTDKENEDLLFYCMSGEVVNEKFKICQQLDCDEEDVPDEYTLKVYKVEKVDTDVNNNEVYDRIPERIVDFPINRIKWLFLRIG